jgi:hypothetical protein
MITSTFVLPTVLSVLLAASEEAEKGAEKAAPIKSGLQKDADVPPFDVLDVTGPNSGKALCYI